MNRRARAAARLGNNARFISADVTSDVSMKHAVDMAVETFGAVHGLVCAAGIAAAERVLPKEGVQPLEHFARVINVNLVGTFNAVRLAAAAMANNAPNDGGRARRHRHHRVGRRIRRADWSGRICGLKGGIVALTLPLARELARIGVRVMTIAPGTFDTPLMAGLPEAARQSLAQQVPFPSRLGRPPEYAALVRHIFENEMLNGEVIRLDGAIRMAPK